MKLTVKKKQGSLSSLKNRDQAAPVAEETIDFVDGNMNVTIDPTINDTKLTDSTQQPNATIFKENEKNEINKTLSDKDNL